MHTRLTYIAAALLITNNALAEDNNAETDIEKIVVTGQYLSNNKSNSVKTPTPILDVPQSLSILTADDITQRNIVSIGQVIDYTPGVTTSQGEGHRDAVVFRGVRSTADFYIDGARDDVQYFRSLYNIEQVEILRGPNALLFGRGGTGGVLNRVTKKAQLNEQFTGYKTSLNSFGGYRAEIDANVATSDDSAIRINAMYEHLENHRDFFDGDRIGFNPTAHFSVSDATRVDLSYEYINHERFIDRGIPTNSNGRPVEAFEEVVFADPENNFNDVEAHVFRAIVQHDFSDTIRGNFSASYADFDKVYSNFFASSFNEDTNVVGLDGYIDSTERQNAIFSGNLVSEFTTGNIDHSVLIGAEAIFTSSDQNRFNSLFDQTDDDVEFFNVSRPLSFRSFSGVNASGITTTSAFSDINDDTRVELDVYSFFIQDEIAISEHLDLVLGVRFDSFDIEVFNVVADETRSRTDDEISPRVGLIYKPQENISIYASYSESFLPRSGEQFANINGDNNQLDPDVFETGEIGIKWDFSEGLSLTAAIFENEQTSLAVSDDDAGRFDVIESEISGFELQAIGQVLDSWSINANYSFLEGENGSTGLTPRELPKHTFSVWNNVQLNDVFGFSIGATYQDESFIVNGPNSSGVRASIPSYVRVDAAAFYDVSDTMRVQLNIENLTDTLYFPNAHAANQVTVGAPINATLTLTGKF
ncbi:TonB-dependent siderophore receptor [Alteromonas sp. 5E99-2]|uniref:TonB-dependent receptor n=1 Tax=Alteromonas sp. 5E99-2 TaxID=2817683 RepID=UPI001A988BA6|nr:TonB-dependent siderophore receptor [Alteromonas sp. 5E99-2]MBO1255810.1 TonB-dependent siderophore receptor [Alteromonas sp. 5E99-2]